MSQADHGLNGSSGSRQTRLSWSVVAVLSLVLVLIGGLRFARLDFAGTGFFSRDRYYVREIDSGRTIENLNIDLVQYLSMVEDFKGVDRAFYRHVPYPEFANNGVPADKGGAVQGPVAPFIYRPFLPWVASILPFDSASSFALVNLVCVLIGLWLLLDALYISGRSPLAQLFGGVLYTVSFPLLVFATSLYIDGGAFGFFVLGYWLIVRKYWWALVLFFPFSYLVKESILILLPVAAWAWRISGRRFRDPWFISGTIVAAAGWWVVSKFARSIAPDPVFAFSVAPNLNTLANNLINVVSIVFFVVGVAPVLVPAALGVRDLWNEQGPRQMVLGPAGPDVVGLALILLLNVYSVASTDLTLRMGWLFYPFAISLSAIWLDRVDPQRLPSWVSKLATAPAPA